ncbi:MAG: hypothetical protein R3A48_23555 [Polyangiales bacterium]
METERVHTTITGHEVRYAPDEGFEGFRARLDALLADPAAGEQEMIGLAYSRANPILAPTPGDLVGDRGAVTREVLQDPRYLVVQDLLARKRFAAQGTDPAVVAAEYTVSLAEAAKALGVSKSAAQQAFAAGRLPSWVKGGRPYTTRRAVDAFAITQRASAKARPGPAPRAPRVAEREAPPERVVVRVDQGPDGVFRLKHAGALEGLTRVAGSTVVEGHLDGWSRVAVLAGAGPDACFYALAPEPGANATLAAEGGFFVRGGFKIVEAVRAAGQSRARWRAFAPE